MWKALVALVLALPVGAYVAGSVMDQRAALPDRRPLVVVDDPAQVLGSTAADPGPDRPAGGRDDADPEDEDDDDIEFVRPDPEDVADELEDRREDAAEDRRDAREDRRDDLEDARDDAADGQNGSDDDHSGRGGGDGSGGDDS